MSTVEDDLLSVAWGKEEACSWQVRNQCDDKEMMGSGGTSLPLTMVLGDVKSVFPLERGQVLVDVTSRSVPVVSPQR